MPLPLLFGSHFEPAGKHCLITGGSQGLGLALAELLASKGADVTIVARSSAKLEKAADSIRKAAGGAPQAPRVAFFSADVSTFEGARRAVQWASGHAERATSAADAEGGDTPASIGRTPDAVFCCAGGAKPGYFIQQTEDDFQAGIKTDYMTALSTAHAAATALAASGKRGARIVLVSSTLGLMGLVGYAQYSPMKFAIRGLAETLRSELQLYGIHVHCYFPGTILSPGYDAENRTKPELTKKLEGGPEEGLTPQQCAAGLLRGVASGRFYITTDFQTELFRAASAGGSVPGNGWLADRVKAFIALIGLPIWRRFIADREIQSHASAHSQEVSVRARSRALTARIARRPYLYLVTLSLLHRLLVLASLLLLPNLFLSPFDSSPELQLLLSPHASPALAWLSALVRWDSVHFLGMASPAALPGGVAGVGAGGPPEATLGGYVWEHSLAFQPGLVWLLRLAGQLGRTVWSPAQAIGFTSLLAVAASSLCPALLFHILSASTSHPHPHPYPRLPLLASLLSILSPSPSTLVTPTPEPFFALFSLLGIALLLSPLDRSTLRPLFPAPPPHRASTLRLVLSAACFALAVAFRANGILLVGYLWYYALWGCGWGRGTTLRRTSKHSHPATQTLLRALLLLPLLSLLAAGPFLLNQLWAWNRFCAGPAPRPWCAAALPSVYSFVQSEYWNVGFLRYWTPSQLPNFLLAAPVLLHAAGASWRYYAAFPTRWVRQTLWGWGWGSGGSLPPASSSPAAAAPPAGDASSSSSSSSPSSTRSPSPVSARSPSARDADPDLLPHMHLSTLLTLTLLLASHVQIALRFASPAWVGLWVGVAGVCMPSPEQSDGHGLGREGGDQVKGKREDKAEQEQEPPGAGALPLPLTRRARWTLAWLVAWNALSIVLYAGFLPPA